MAGKKTFLCYAAEDEHRVPALLAALEAWDVSFHLLNPTQQPAHALQAETDNQIRDCEVYVRVCTSATRASPQIILADEIFLKLLEADRRQGNWEKRKLVNLIFDPAYPLDEQEKATLYIETSGKTRALWLEQLAVPLGVATLRQRISRRALVSTGIGASLAVAFGGTLYAVLLNQQRQQELSQRILPNANHVSGQPNWTIPVRDFMNDKTNVSIDAIYENGALYAVATDGGTIGVYSLFPDQQSAYRLPLDLSTIQSNFSSIDSVYLRGGVLFVTYIDSNGQIHNTVFDLRTGSLAYRLDTANIGIPSVVGNNFYAVNFSQSGDSFVTAFRLRDGSRIWQQPISLDPTAYNGLDSVDIVRVSQGLVYVSTFDHTLTCFDAGSGKPRWQFHLNGQATAPVISGGSVYFAVWDGSIFALDAATGTRRWKTTIDETLTTAPTIDGDTIYVSSADGYLHAVDAGSGALYWRSLVSDEETNNAPPLIEFPPVVYRNVVAVASVVPGGVFAYDLRDGSSRWRFTLISELHSFYQPLVYHGLVVVGVDDGKVYAFNP